MDMDIRESGGKKRNNVETANLCVYMCVLCWGIILEVLWGHVIISIY